MNKIVLLGINSKFVHTNIAIRYIKKYVENNSGFKLNILEKTINDYEEKWLWKSSWIIKRNSSRL